MLEWSFILKKMVAAVCMPLPLFFLLITVSLILFWRRKFVFAKVFSVISVIFLYLISIQVTGDLLANTLERQYPQYHKNKNLDYVLVLGSGHVSDASQPISSLLSSAGLSRLVEGVRIYRLNPGSKLLLSGYRFNDEISHAHALKKVALHFGVPASDMVLAEHVKDTQEEASHWVTFAAGKSLALVTSASHMPRSMFLFKNAQKSHKIKATLTPAPTDFITHRSATRVWKSWFPSGRYLERVERIWHEQLGLLWAKLVAGL